ncbi:MAG: methyltransferase domain-containing protein [Candidatus Nealsonbacteria bacterium]
MEENYAKYLLRKTKENYNLISKDFSRSRARAWPETEFLKEYVSGKERVLDLGCGNGRFYDVLQEKKIDYFGLDFSEELIKMARDRHPQLEFQVADALNLPFSDDFFDKVFSIAVLHHIPSNAFRLRFLKEVKRVLKKEGMVILTVWDLGNIARLGIFVSGVFLGLFKKSKFDLGDSFIPWGKNIKRYIHAFSERELKILVKEAGFKIKRTERMERPNGKTGNILIVIQKA